MSHEPGAGQHKDLNWTVSYKSKICDLEQQLEFAKREYHDAIQIRWQRDRLLTLATKHCDRSHHDWDEILDLASKCGMV